MAAFDAKWFWILQGQVHRMRWFLISIVAAVVAIGVYIGSAIVSLNGLVGAAKAGNGAEMLARTDVRRLKRSLVHQIVTAYLIRTGQNRPIRPIERLLANTYGATIADALVAKMRTVRIPGKATTLSGAWRPRDPVDDDRGGARA